MLHPNCHYNAAYLKSFNTLEIAFFISNLSILSNMVKHFFSCIK